MEDVKKVEDISIQLRRGKSRPLFCMICRTGLYVVIEGFPVSVFPGNPNAEGTRNLKFPIIIRCTGKSEKWGRCPARWIIEGYVEE